MIQAKDFTNLIVVVVKQFDTIVSDPAAQQSGNNFRRTLRSRVEQSIAAANVSSERMFKPNSISKFNLVNITGPPTVGLVRTG